LNGLAPYLNGLGPYLNGLVPTYLSLALRVFGRNPEPLNCTPDCFRTTDGLPSGAYQNDPDNCKPPHRPVIASRCQTEQPKGWPCAGTAIRAFGPLTSETVCSSLRCLRPRYIPRHIPECDLPHCSLSECHLPQCWLSYCGLPRCRLPQRDPSHYCLPHYGLSYLQAPSCSLLHCALASACVFACAPAPTPALASVHDHAPTSVLCCAYCDVLTVPCCAYCAVHTVLCLLCCAYWVVLTALCLLRDAYCAGLTVLYTLCCALLTVLYTLCLL